MEEFVATVRLRERLGSAIGVCESPPLIELGSSAADVIVRMKKRLAQLISPVEGAAQRLLVIRDGHAEAEPLR